MNDLYYSLVQSTELHLLAAILLGLLIAINPCQIAISLSALASIVNRNSNEPAFFMRKVIYFTLGRVSFYLLTGIILFFLVRYAKINSEFFYSERIAVFIDRWIPFITAFLGIVFLIRALHNHHHNDKCHNSGNLIKKNKNTGVFLLGFILASLFCPESAILFFGMMLPLSFVSKLGFLLLPIFCIAAAIPIVLIAYICKLSIEKSIQWETRLENIQFYINIISAVSLLTITILLLI